MIFFAALSISPIAQAEGRTQRFWRDDAYWNAQEGPRCVAYAWVNWLTSADATHEPSADAPVSEYLLYRLAQEQDGIPGNDYAGTTVEGGAKALKDLGLITEWHHAVDWSETQRWLLHNGPVVVGTDWYNAFADIGARRVKVLNIAPNTGAWGRHAYLLDGIDKDNDNRFDVAYTRFKNSWGRWWGYRGYGRVTLRSMRDVVLFGHDNSVEVVMATRPPSDLSSVITTLWAMTEKALFALRVISEPTGPLAPCHPDAIC